LGTSGGSTIRYKVSYNPIEDGEFEEYWNTWDEDASGNEDQEDATLRATGPWWESGTSGAVTLNKSSPLIGKRDCEIALDSADTRLVTRTKWALKPSTAYTFGLRHIESNAAVTIDYAIQEMAADGEKYLQSGGTWSATAYWFTIGGSAVAANLTKQFTSDEEVFYDILIRPTTATIAAETSNIDQVFIVEDAAAADTWHLGGPELVAISHDARVSGIVAAGSETLNVSTLQGDGVRNKR
jgi:hypothetical protein